MKFHEMNLIDFLIPGGVALLFLGVLVGVHRFLEWRYRDDPKTVLRRQLVMLVLSLCGIPLLVVFLPISETLRGQILSLVGILLSATIALSSTTFLGNALAGILLRSLRSFRSGDFIRVQDHFGRVSGRGLFHVEIQGEDRDLTTLPNLYLATNPVKVTQASGTIVSTEVSLGYDVSRLKIEKCLEEAALEAELQDAFVHILKLGDFSVTYRVSGFLAEGKQILSARSRLNGAVLDALHRASIEIVSPGFMNTRAVGERVFIPKRADAPAQNGRSVEPESIIFDKAEEAETIEKQTEHARRIEGLIDEAKESLKKAESEEEKEEIKERLARLEEGLTLLKKKIELHEDAVKG